VVRPPARQARVLALVLSSIAVAFSLGFGVSARATYAAFDANDLERYFAPAMKSLVFLLFALLFRMAAAICELLWLARTWSNLPEVLRKVGPIDNVSSDLVVGLSFVPGISWVWKLGLVVAVSNGFERVRAEIPFTAKVPRRLGLAAVIVAWVPGLNVYLAPFLWELFAKRIDVICGELRCAQGARGAPPT
jgi:hypothetical protein